jgi:hypothetical protein
MVNKNSAPQPLPNLNKSYSGNADNNSPSKLTKPTSENNNKKSGFGITSNRYFLFKLGKIWSQACKIFKT